jgi:hypothetical protein
LTFKDLKRRVSRLDTTQEFKTLEQLRDKPFWIWNIEEHKREDIKTNGNCCFNHIVGLPVKGRTEKPLFDYEKLLYDSLLTNEHSNILSHTDNHSHNYTFNFKYKHLWVKKSTGLGVTEFFLRLMVWLCLRNDDYRNSQMCIVTGPNIDIAIKLIKRMKALFEPKLGIIFDSKETVLELNGCTIEAYPSNHLDSYRALDNPKFILIDEGDFFRKGEQEDVRHVSERYIAKSDPYIVMVSTPNAPDETF